MCGNPFKSPKVPEVKIPETPVMVPKKEEPESPMRFNPEIRKRKKAKAGTRSLQIPLGGVNSESSSSGLNVPK